ncbi:outer membrane beta-barrel protein [Rhodohalobacter halophilus]|uniref:outer membrane beta-barrel protein n=1 Tax=Rhodohalobacter halophilus TaxID=1812810 RepID=UPI000A04392D|nr:outer membrane beta-barrel protein [Rhodohalobacter halophilus]
MRIPAIILYTALLLLFMSFSSPDDGYAQVGIGGGLDIRSEELTNGYGVRLEYTFFKLPPIADFRFRLHGSYFYEESAIQSEVNGLRSTVTQSSSAFDVGVAVLAGVNIGMIGPYAGVGLGVDSSEINPRQGITQYSRIKEENIFWNVLFGAELEMIPYVKPFFEYRFMHLFQTGNIDFKESERLSLGVVFRF